MPGITKIIKLIREMESLTARCSRCGACMAACPLFAHTFREPDVARGKMALIEGLAREMFKTPDGVRSRLNRCLLCGSCEANCPSGVKIIEIYLKARVILTGYTGLSIIKKTLLRTVLAHPHFFDRMLELMASKQRFLFKPVNETSGASRIRFIPPAFAGRHIVPLAPEPFHKTYKPLKPLTSGSAGRVAFFTGCLIDKLFPGVGHAVVDALAYHHVDVFIPDGQGCCGMPAISSGDFEAFHQLVVYNLEKFRLDDFDYLVTACPTCAVAIKKIWPVMAINRMEKFKLKINAIAQKTMDINQFLASKTGLKKQEKQQDVKPVNVTYHEPCHLKKSLGVSSEPRALINANSGYRLVEMPESDHCCGMGGSFNLHYYGLSTDIGMKKKVNIINSSCRVVATACPACMVQLTDMLSKSGKPFQIKHTVEIYNETLKIRDENQL